METNVGGTDRRVRLVVGALAGLASLGTLGNLVELPAVVSPVLGVVALVMVTTSLTGSCPLYSVLGVRTCPANR
jgi:hypothetical protein